MKRNKIYIKRLSVLLVVWGIIVGMAPKASAQSQLNIYLQTAAENNAGLKVKFNTYMASLEKVPQVSALPDPNVAFAYFIQPVETKLGPQQAKISLSQMFPWFGTLSARSDAATAMAQSKYALFNDAKVKLFYEVKATYYDLYFTQKAIGITKDNLKILESFKKLANIRVEAGAVSAADAYRAEMEWNDLYNQLAVLKDKQAVLEIRFNRLLNVQDTSAIIIDAELKSTLLVAKQMELDSVMANNYQLSSIDNQQESLQYRETIARKEGMPQFSVGLDYTFIGTDNSTAADAGQDAFVFPKIGLTVPLYRSKYRAKVNEVKYLQEANKSEKEEKENRLRVVFENTWNDYTDALRRESLYTTQTDLAEKTMSVVESDYTTGKMNFEEILRLEQKLLKYSLELQKAKVDKASSVAFINYLKGK